MATVSIIIPVYNAEHTLERCVDSVLGQEFTDFELLLVDDGSSDGSPALCDRYAALAQSLCKRRCVAGRVTELDNPNNTDFTDLL